MSASDDATAASDALAAAIAGPLEVSGDAGTVRNHNLKDLAKVADRAAAKSTRNSPFFGCVVRKLSPPGTAGNC